MKRSIMFWLYFVVAIIFGVYFATRIVMVVFDLNNEKLARIHNPVAFTIDPADADLTALEKVVAGNIGDKTNSLNLVSLNNRISEIPNVKDSAVRRMPNGTLHIRVNFYSAVAQWTNGHEFFPLASDGTIVQTPFESRDPSAIVFRGELPKNISDITAAAQLLVSHIDYMEWIENRRWNIITTGGIKVMLPENDPVAAIRSLNSLNEKQNILAKNINTIDMRDPARILVK